MLSNLYKTTVSILILFSCQTGTLTVLADLPRSLEEISASEVIVGSDLVWVIQDAGNSNRLYGLDTQGGIVKNISIKNAENIDWEDITSDEWGNLYIGDFGNNSEKRKQFSILKVKQPENQLSEALTQTINFSLPKKVDSKDFEAFFLFKNYFYIFSKGKKNEILIKVPNIEGTHVAELVDTFNLPGGNNEITSADISDDGKTVVLLNHEKVWKLSNFESHYFFKGEIEKLEFNHTSQKEGICFKNNNQLYITDERDKNDDGNLYSFNLK